MTFISTLLLSLFLYGILFFSGYLLAKKIGITFELEKIGIGILISTHLFTYASFLLYSYLGVRYTKENLLISLFFLFLCIMPYVINKIRKGGGTHRVFKMYLERTKEKIPKYDVLFFVALLSIPILFTCVQNIHWPVVDWDAIALYDYRAKVFTTTGGMEDGIRRGYFLHYPLYTSLLHTYSYLLNIQTVRVWYSFMYIATIFVFYSLLKRNVSTKRALFGTFLLAISPRILQHSQMTYTNLPHAVYLALGYIYLWEWQRNGKKVDIIVGSLLVSGSMWVRLTEPLWLPIILLILIGIWKWKKQWKISSVMIFLILILREPWTSFVKHYDQLDISNPLQIGLGLQLPRNILEYFTRFQEVVKFFLTGILPMFKQYVPAIVIASLYALYKEKWNEVFEFFIFYVLVLFIFLGIFIFSFQFKGWQDIPDSAARMTMFLLPLAVYLIMKSDLWSIPTKQIK